MTHFTDDELVDLVLEQERGREQEPGREQKDDAVPPARRAHLQECDACRAQAGVLSDVLARVVEDKETGVPEPSPLFWNHLSARVHDAIAAPRPATWRDRVWLPRAAWTAGLASVALAAAVSHSMLTRAPLTKSPSAVSINVLNGSAASADAADDIEADEAWALVRSVADDVGLDEAHDAGISTRPDAAERMTLELSTREQSELARLLQGELKR
jgi:hypothetical protein